MDKNTLSHYGWVVICLIIIAILLGLATPFGSFVKESVLETAHSFGSTVVNSLSNSKVEAPGNEGNNAGVSGQLDHTVTFMVDGEVYEVVSVKDGNRVNEPIDDPVKKGQAFTGWHDGNTSPLFPITPTDDIVLHATFSSSIDNFYNKLGIDKEQYPNILIGVIDSSSSGTKYLIYVMGEGKVEAGSTFVCYCSNYYRFDTSYKKYTTNPTDLDDILNEILSLNMSGGLSNGNARYTIGDYNYYTNTNVTGSKGTWILF